jgi:hypothetical protein
MVSPATPSFINFIIIERLVAKEGVVGETMGFPTEKLIMLLSSIDITTNPLKVK